MAGGGIIEPKLDGDESTAPLRRVTKGPIGFADYWVPVGRSIVLDGAEVGRACLVGAGAVVMHNIPDGATFATRPGLVLKRAKR